MSSISLGDFFPRKKEFLKHLFSPCTLGFISEREHKDKLREILKTNGWKFKYRRPYKVVYKTYGGVFIVFLTTSETDFYCKTDLELGLQETPQIDTERCEKYKPECGWIKGTSRMFKLRAGKSNCYLFRLSPKLLKKMGEICGRCDKQATDRSFKRVVAYELKKYWNIEVEEK